MAKIRIRFNNMFAQAPDPDLKWRLLQGDDEILARDIKINVPCFTTHDLLPNGIEKWHITCEGVLKDDGNGHYRIEMV